MCSIFGMKKPMWSNEFIEGEFSKTNDRGPDATRYIYNERVALGFKRLSIMGLNERGIQPFFYNDIYVVCNGEIYGFRDIKREFKDYPFVSESDCEVLLPLYIKYGLDMFKHLDAEFALILYDAKEDKIIAGRDPLGIRPLYYGVCDNGEYVFASEPIVLLKMVDKVKPFPPGHYFDGEKFVCYNDITSVNDYVSGDIDTKICPKIKSFLIDAVEKRLDSDAPLGFLLSGGLDSSLVCAIAAKKLKKPIKTFAIGMVGDAIDLKYAKEVSDYLHTDHKEFYMTKDDVISSLREIIYHLGTFDITTIRASVGMYLLCKKIKEETNVKVLLTGEVSDELFGYKYTDYAPSALEFQAEAQKRIRELHMYDVLRADRCISSNSLEARVPFGDIDYVKYVMSIDPKLKLNTYNKGKYLLRHAFEGDYLPHDILYREKAAFSDAVGHSMVDIIKEYANSYYSDNEFNEKIKKYDYVRPFTKESLLYREIFEEFYPNQAQMIVDFWMPNRSWPGCNVDDPSARVLANYKDSGK